MGKAFDRVNRDLLFYKMLKLGKGRKVYQCIKYMYDGCKASINLNGHLNDAFATEYGVKQGDFLSPTLFSLFINDMANEIKSNCNGVSPGNFDVHCLLYADDLVLLAETEEILQCMLDTVLLWCRKWHMKINPKNPMLYILDHRAMWKHPMNSNTGMRIYSQYRDINIWGLSSTNSLISIPLPLFLRIPLGEL